MILWSEVVWKGELSASECEKGQRGGEDLYIYLKVPERLHRSQAELEDKS